MSVCSHQFSAVTGPMPRWVNQSASPSGTTKRGDWPASRRRRKVP